MKYVNFVLMLVICFSACTNQPSSNNAEQEKMVRQYFDYFNQHNWEKMAGMYADTALFKDPSLGNGIVKQSHQQTIQKYTELQKLFPDLHDQIVQIYPAGDQHVVVEFVSSGTGPDQVKFELPICTIFTFEKGKITKDFTYYDNFETTDSAK